MNKNVFTTSDDIKEKNEDNYDMIIKLSITCPQGELCRHYQGYLNNIKSVGDDIHFKKYSHFCPYFEEECKFKNCDLHKNFKHLCRDNTNCPYIYYIPVDEHGIQQYNEHMNKYFHTCKSGGSCPILHDVLHRSQYSHKTEMKITINPEISSPKPINFHSCDTCGAISLDTGELNCKHIMCRDCFNFGKNCELCNIIDNLNQPQNEIKEKI
jgi:hypothetical protein